MKYLLDTNVVSEVSRKKSSGKVLNFLLANEPLCAIPAIVLAERYQGARLAPAEIRERMTRTVDEFYAEFKDRILPFDSECARAWAEYVTRPALRRQPKSYPDTQIAAIALAHNLILVTRNTADFPEIQTLDPFE